MGAADMATWRRNNSDVHPVELLLVDGTVLRGSILVSRDKTIREFFNILTDPFIDFECKREGTIVLAKSSVRRVLPEGAQKKEDHAKIDALTARQAELERNDPYKLLGVGMGVDAEALRAAYISKARMYHPDKFADAGLPQEVFEYLNAMARRVNAAYEDIGHVLEAAAKKAKAEAAAAPAAAAPGKRF
jgi:DnaJ domain